MGKGDYTGKDKYGGWNKHSGAIKESAQKGLDLWQGEQAGAPTGRYGIGKELGEMDLAGGAGFDVSNVDSIAEALAKKQFYEDTTSEISDQQPGDKPLFRDEDKWLGSGDEATGVWGAIGGDWTETTGLPPSENPYGPHHSYKPYATADPGEMESYYQTYKQDLEDEGGMDLFKQQVRTAGITPQALAGLDPGAQEWRRMEQPLMAEATDVYRENLGSVMSGLGNLRTGSAQKRRQNLLKDYGQSMFDIRAKTAGERGKRSSALAGRIAKLFQ